MEKALTSLRKMRVVQLPEPYVSLPATRPSHTPATPWFPKAWRCQTDLGYAWDHPACNRWQGRAQMPGKLTPQQEVCLEGRRGVALVPPAVTLVAGVAQPAPSPVPMVQRLGTGGTGGPMQSCHITHTHTHTHTHVVYSGYGALQGCGVGPPLWSPGQQAPGEAGAGPGGARGLGLASALPPFS